MTEHPNAVAARRSYEAWNSGDLDVIRGYFTDDAVLHFAGNNAMSGTYRGRDAVMDALARAGQGWGPHAEMEVILGSDDHVITFFHVTSKRDGKILDVVLTQAITFNAEGKVTEAWFLPNDQRGYDQFFSLLIPDEHTPVPVDAGRSGRWIRGRPNVCRPHAREAPCQTLPNRLLPRNG